MICRVLVLNIVLKFNGVFGSGVRLGMGDSMVCNGYGDGVLGRVVLVRCLVMLGRWFGWLLVC